MSQELLPCPFCGCAMHIDSNRDTHKLDGIHTPECLWFEDGPTITAFATDSARAAMIEVWNRRATPSPQPEKDGEREALPTSVFRALDSLLASWVRDGNSSELAARRIKARADLEAAISDELQAARSAPRAALTEGAMLKLARDNGMLASPTVLKLIRAVERAVREGGGQ